MTHKAVKTALYAAAASAVYLGLGNLLYSQILSRKAAVRGFAGWPPQAVIDGAPAALPESFADKLAAKITGQGSGMEGFFGAPYFPVFQAGVRWFFERNPEKATIASPRGGCVHAEKILSEKPSDLWLICLHGYTSCPWANGAPAKAFYGWGFNILLPHLCGHPGSEDSFVSMGWLDRLDVLAWIEHLIRENPQAKIVLYGASMGAAAVMMTTGEKLPGNVVCAIEDCGFTSLWDLLCTPAKQALRSGALVCAGLYALDAVTRLRTGFSIREASCVEQLKKSATPTLFIHGDADRGVPVWMLQKLYDAAACEKEMLIVPGADHGEAMYHPELFYGAIRKFLDIHLNEISQPREYTEGAFP